MAEVIDFLRTRLSKNSDHDVSAKAFDAAAAKLGYASAPEVEFVAGTINSDVRRRERNAEKLCDHALTLLNDGACNRPDWASPESWEQLIPFRSS